MKKCSMFERNGGSRQQSAGSKSRWSMGAWCRERRRICLQLLALGICLALLPACGGPAGSSVPEGSADPAASAASTTATAAGEGDRENPFDYQGPSDILGSMAHRLDYAEEGDEADILRYTGNEMVLPYCMAGSGSGRNLGFLVYWNGIPQPYRVNDEEEAAYLHTFVLQQDDAEEKFTIRFCPVEGEAGETATVTIASVYYPQFEPDMVSSSSFGFYQGILSNRYEVSMDAAAPAPEANRDLSGARKVEALSGVTLSNELMTEDFIQSRLNSMGMQTSDEKSREELLSENVYSFELYDGAEEYNDLDVSGKKSLHVSYELCGVPGASYRITLYADHMPLSEGGVDSWEVTLEKGKVAKLEADIQLDALPEAVTTFYFTACSVGGKGVRGMDIMKTSSKPIWSQERLGEDPGESTQGEPGSGSSSEGPDYTQNTPDGTDQPVQQVRLPDCVDDSVRALYYGADGTVLVRKADGLYLADLTTGAQVAAGALPALKSAEYHSLGSDKGFCVMGEVEDSAGGTVQGQLGTEVPEEVCIFLDPSLTELKRISLTDLTGGEKRIMSRAVSPDGQHLAYSVMQDGIYLLDCNTGTVSLLCSLDRDHREENHGVSMVTGLWFSEDGTRVIYTDNTNFGSMGLDGADFTCFTFEGFEPQGAVGYAGGKLFFNESFFSPTGLMAAADPSTGEYITYQHSAAESRGDLFVSQKGGYFATAVYQGGLVVRVYRTEDNSLLLEETITDENQDMFMTAPGILLLDDLQVCLVKIGGTSEVPSRVLLLPFGEGNGQ